MSAIATAFPAVNSSIIAKRHTNGVGRRIVVDDLVEPERISDEVNAYTHRVDKGA